MRYRLMKETARCRAWAMEKLNSYPSASSSNETHRASLAFRSAREVFQDMDDGEPQSMSQALWLISLD